MTTRRMEAHPLLTSRLPTGYSIGFDKDNHSVHPMQRVQQSDLGPPSPRGPGSYPRPRPLRAVPDTSHRSSHLPMLSRALAPKKVIEWVPSTQVLSPPRRDYARAYFWTAPLRLVPHV